ASGSVVDLARDIGRRPEDLSQAAARLSSQGALERDRDGAWQLCADEDFRQGLDTFAKAIHDHKDRLYVLTRLLENLSR
ncbi:MAG: hypothetical protein M1274_00165, partial [Actinobacteria bacterium]|nr:hypothetical protein [Actinomycetota bacterium]